MNKEREILFIVGNFAVGKTTVCRLLEEYGYIQIGGKRGADDLGHFDAIVKYINTTDKFTFHSCIYQRSPVLPKLQKLGKVTMVVLNTSEYNNHNRALERNPNSSFSLKELKKNNSFMEKSYLLCKKLGIKRIVVDNNKKPEVTVKEILKRI